MKPNSTALMRCLPLLALLTIGCSSSDKKAAPAQAPQRLTLLQTTDIHHMAQGVGHVGIDATGAPQSAAVGGFARLGGFVNAVRDAAKNESGRSVALVDSGDWSMGSLYDLTLTSQPIGLYSMMAMGYNCMTLGNHEFDYTPKGLAGMLEAATGINPATGLLNTQGSGRPTGFGFWIPMVQSNMQNAAMTEIAHFVGEGKTIQPTHTEVLSNGLKVGYVGLMGKTASDSAPNKFNVKAPFMGGKSAKSKGSITFQDFNADPSSLQALVTELRDLSRCHIVVALSHAGLNLDGKSGEDVELAQKVRGIDVIASGHSHFPLSQSLTVPYTGAGGSWNTHIVSAGPYGASVAKLDLAYIPGAAGQWGSTQVEDYRLAPMTDAGLAAFKPGLSGESAFQSIVSKADLGLNTALQSLFTSLFPDNDGLVPTGVIRGELEKDKALTFADIYNVFPLGISPDATQSLPIGYPLISAYAELQDLKTLFALQLLAQCGLTSSDLYLNLSGVKPTLDAAKKAEFFQYVTAAMVLKSTKEKKDAGSSAAQSAWNALLAMSQDGGVSMMAQIQAGNAFAIAMAKLTDANLANANANLQITGTVGLTYVQGGESALRLLLAGKSMAAISGVSAYAAADATCTSAASALDGSTRYRIAANLYAILMMGAVQSQTGLPLNAYQAKTGDVKLGFANVATAVMANRINLKPGAVVTETKEWMALLQYIKALSNQVPSAYASGDSFAQWSASGPSAAFGAAVWLRNSHYPAGDVIKLAQTVATLQGQ